MKLPIAVIVGMETNGLGVSRALSAYKIPCIGLAGPHRTPSCHTNTCEIVYAYASSWSKEGVISVLKSIGERLDHKAPLLITKDEPVLWISECRHDLSEFYEINLPSKTVVDLLMNKRKFQELSAIEDWPLPKTWEINNKDELLSCLEDLVYPCILKPQIKNSAFRKYGPKKAFKILNEDELIDVYEIVAQWEKEVVIQEWIKGGDDRVGFCLTYWTRNSEPLVMFAGRKLRQFPIECGCTAIAEPAPKEWQDLIISLTQKIWRKVEFKGLGSIEFKLRPDTNTPVIMEPTVGRTDLQNELAVINGYNIPAIAYFDLIGHNYKPLRSPSKPVKLIDGMAELKAALEYHRKGELGFVQWLNDRSGKKKYMLYRENDLGPFVASVTIGIYNFMKKLIRKMIKLI